MSYLTSIKSLFFPDGFQDCLLQLQPRQPSRGRGFYFVDYSEDLVAAHCAGTEILSVASVNSQGMSRLIALDIDNINLPDTSAQNLQLALSAYNACQSNKLLEQSSPNGSYHVWFFLDTPIPATDAITRIQGIVGTNQVETRPTRGTPAWAIPYYTNESLRVPGLHPTYGSWSQIYNGTTFVDVRDYFA